MISCILLAAGAGKRMHCEENKIFLRLGSFSLLQWNLIHLKDVPSLTEVIIVVAEGELQAIQREVQQFISHYKVSFCIRYVQGGKERQDSVAAGIQAIQTENEIILIHDGARPLAKAELFAQVTEAAKLYGAAVTAVPAIDTIKRVNPTGEVIETLRRAELYLVQTPQGFQRDILVEAHAYAKKINFLGTDDVSLVEKLGKTVKIVPGDYQNIKVTTPNDLVCAKSYLGVKAPMMRVGFGYDIHQLKEGRPCILGGVTIESPTGPDGHSDADVLLHALMDAMLGAAGLKDIGYYFPPEDDAYKGISSLLLLEKVNCLLKEKGFRAYNIDVMVVAEAPKLKPHIDAMKENISKIINIPIDCISIKATTNEKLGAIGRQEGIAAQAVVTLYEREDF